MMDEGTTQIGAMKTVFNEKEPQMEEAYTAAKEAHDEGTMADDDWSAAETTWADFQADKAAAFGAIATVEASVDTLMTTIRGEAAEDEDAAAGESAAAAAGRQRRAASTETPTKQGMTDGLFSVVQCYQVNARYQAVVNMLCSQFFDTIAMTVEYLLVAGVFMVIVEFCKRWMRPYNQAFEKGNAVTPIGDDRWDVAKGREPSNAGETV